MQKGICKDFVFRPGGCCLFFIVLVGFSLLRQAIAMQLRLARISRFSFFGLFMLGLQIHATKPSYDLKTNKPKGLSLEIKVISCTNGFFAQTQERASRGRWCSFVLACPSSWPFCCPWPLCHCHMHLNTHNIVSSLKNGHYGRNKSKYFKIFTLPCNDLPMEPGLHLVSSPAA